MSAQHLLMPEVTLKLFDCVLQGRALRFVKKDSGNAFNNRFDCAATTKCDNRATGSIHFKGRELLNLSEREIRSIFSKLGLEPRFVGEIPPQLRPRSKTQLLSA